MNKFNEWFKKNVFEACYVDGDCYRISLFGVSIDFRNWFVLPKDIDPNQQWFLDWETRSLNEHIEKKNKKRKNKFPLYEFKKVPWYISIVNWRSLYYRSRILIGFIVGFILGGVIF